MGLTAASRTVRPSRLRVAFVTMLLRAGASLDGCRRSNNSQGRDTAEDVLQSLESYWTLHNPGDEIDEAEHSPYLRRIGEGKYTYLIAEQEVHWTVIKALVHGVRRYGTYKKYIRAPHRDVLTVHGLVQRGNLSTEEPDMSFLARLDCKFVVWHILGYWRATD